MRLIRLRLYEGSCQQFVEDSTKNRIADKLKASFEDYYGHRANPGEVASWTNSLRFLKDVIESKSLYGIHVILEYELPYSTKRIDCILMGTDSAGRESVMVIELKQWSVVEDCDVDDNVVTYVGGAKRMVPHPSFQVRSYHFFLKDFMDLFENGVDLRSCVYCHNYSRKDDSVLFSERFHKIVNEFPIFTKEDFEKFGDHLKERLEKGKGLELFNRFKKAPIKPSKKLIDHTEKMIQGQKAFTLIDEQLTANNTILDRARRAAKSKGKSVIIVKGGPGTGKSVIALNVLAELLKKGHSVYHATGSKAFTETLRKIVGTRTAKFFKYFNSFGKAEENSIDVLICDEAHRIRETSNSRFTPSWQRSNIPQVEELIRVAKVSIFFVDEYQIVRPSEVGGIDMIKDAAMKFGVEDSEIFDFELMTQFRCSGSDGYLSWVDNMLNIRDTANRVLTKNEKMEFRIFDSPQKLYEAIKKKNRENPNSARLVAGFCWPWSEPNQDGTLKDDVVIGDFQMPWEGKPGRRLARGIPPAHWWAYDPNGVNQIGCIYTIQGFEFDYVGVVFGKDLVYDPRTKEWVGKPENSADSMVRGTRQDFVRYVKNVYRTLLTRGMRGCYVYFMDKDTETHFRSMIEMG
jgi:DUF2075 family protein